MRKALAPCIVLLCLVLLGLADAQAAPKRGGVVAIGVPGEAGTLNPVFAENPVEIMIGRCLFGSLYRTDQDGDFAPELLVKMPERKGFVYEYQLKAGVKFSDGHEVTAEDVKFTWKMLSDPKHAWANSADWQEVKAVEIPLLSLKGKDDKVYKAYDKYRFRVTLRRTYALYDLLWANTPIVPKHVIEKEMSSAGGKLDKNGRFARYPVGSGPFVVKEWRPDSRLVLARNPSYFRAGQPYLDEIVWRVLPDDAGAALAMLRAGEIDLCGSIRFDLFSEAHRIPGLRVWKTPSFTYNHIELNLWDPKDLSKPHPILADRRVRQALDRAFPREMAVDKILGNVGYAAYASLSPASWGFAKDLARPRSAKEDARALLEAAGWRDADGDGIREKDGRPLRLTIQSNTGNRVREEIEALCREHWREIGVDLAIANVDFATLIGHQAKRDFDLLLTAWVAAEDPDSTSIWHSGQIPAGGGASAGQNFSGYRNPEMDALMTEGLAESDREKRRPLYHRMQEILIEDVPYIFVNFYARVSVFREGLENYRPNPGSASDLWNVDEWYWAR